MKKLSIVMWPAKVLETRATEINCFDRELREFAHAMHEAMRQANGIGLSANQVGVLQRVLVIEIPWRGNRYEKEGDEKRPWHDTPYTIINPEIIDRRGKIVYEEGCLSFPGIFGEVERSSQVRVRYQDLDGNRQQLEADGLLSVCLQHEIDHLDGIVFITHFSKIRMESVKQQILGHG